MKVVKFLICCLFIICFGSCQKEDDLINKAKDQESIQEVSQELNHEVNGVNYYEAGEKSTWYNYPTWYFNGIAQQSFSVSGDKLLIIVWNDGPNPFRCNVTTSNNCIVGSDIVPVNGSRTYQSSNATGCTSANIQIIHTTLGSISGSASVSYRY